MKRLMSKYFPRIFLAITISFGFSSCNVGKPAANTTWSLVKLVTVGDPIETPFSEVVEVKNCGIPVEKITECSAGTSNDLNLTMSSGGAFGTGSQFLIEGGVGTTLGIGQQSGESAKLLTPPDGFVYIYTVNKVYRTVTGEILAQSSDGDKQVVNFNFHASCSIDIVSRDQVSCSANSSEPNNQSSSSQEIYDSFDNKAYEGKWDDSTWAKFGIVSLIQQRDGTLVISREANSVGGIVAYQRKWLLSQIDYVESRMMLNSNIQTQDGDIGVEINSTINGNWWFAKCGIHGEKSKNALVLCDTMDKFSITPVEVSYNTWHVVRLEVDSTRTAITFFVDGQNVGEYIPHDPSSFKSVDFALQLNSWSSSGGFISGNFDYVQLKTK